MAYIIKHTGEITKVQPKNGTDFQLDELQAVVGGCIEVIYSGRINNGRLFKVGSDGAGAVKITTLDTSGGGWIMVCNEDLPNKEDAFNEIASLFYANFPDYDFIGGDVLLCRDSEVQ